MRNSYTVLLALGVAMMAGACGREETPSAPSADAAPGPSPAVAPQVAKGRYAPRDECGSLPGASAFRGRLAAAVKARDADALVALASPTVQLDYGGGNGHALLRQRLADPQYNLWAELDEIVTLGCAAGPNGEITLPWLFAQDFGDLDVLNSLIVTGEDVPLRETADPKSSEIGRISWDTVTLAESWSPDAPFFKVSGPGGKTGYVPRGMTRPIAGYRVIGAREGGEWRISMLIAGD